MTTCLISLAGCVTPGDLYNQRTSAPELESWSASYPDEGAVTFTFTFSNKAGRPTGIELHLADGTDTIYTTAQGDIVVASDQSGFVWTADVTLPFDRHTYLREEEIPDETSNAWTFRKAIAFGPKDTITNPFVTGHAVTVVHELNATYHPPTLSDWGPKGKSYAPGQQVSLWFRFKDKDSVTQAESLRMILGVERTMPDKTVRHLTFDDQRPGIAEFLNVSHQHAVGDRNHTLTFNIPSGAPNGTWTAANATVHSSVVYQGQTYSFIEQVLKDEPLFTVTYPSGSSPDTTPPSVVKVSADPDPVHPGEDGELTIRFTEPVRSVLVRGAQGGHQNDSLNEYWMTYDKSTSSPDWSFSTNVTWDFTLSEYYPEGTYHANVTVQDIWGNERNQRFFRMFEYSYD